MAHQDGGNVKVGAGVRMKADGRTGTITKVWEDERPVLYDVEFDRSPGALLGLAVRDFAVLGITAEAFDVLP